MSGALELATRFEVIKQLGEQQRDLGTAHASERLEEKWILEWQVVPGVATGQWIEKFPNRTPHPTN